MKEEKAVEAAFEPRRRSPKHIYPHEGVKEARADAAFVFKRARLW